MTSTEKRERAGGPTLSARALVRGARGVVRLDASIDVAPGVTILFGPSGAGKSTLLAVIAGLIKPDAGRVALGDDVWLDTERRVDVPIHERRVALVFQSLALFPHMTALENASYGVPRDVPAAERAARATDALGHFRASHLAGRRPSTFSGGEAQRVALARAFAMRPRLFLLDEPFSAMDRELREELTGLVPSIAEELGVPVLHVTHHRREAKRIGDRVIIVRDGRVEAVGGTELLDDGDAA